MTIRFALLGGVALAAVAASPGLAQSPVAPDPAANPSTSSASAPSDDLGLADIVVTAQRTSQSLQKVPLAVSAVTSADLGARQLTGSLDLENFVPNLALSTNGSALIPFLRGVGSNQPNPNDEASVATYIDGVYVPSVIGNIFKFNNIERIEVLKGPQGTLFGRNATGGVIQIITRDPSFDPTLDVSVGGGTHATTEVAAYAATGLTDTLAMDVALSWDRVGDGFGRNITLDKDIFKFDQKAVRSKILWKPGASTEVRVTGDYSHLKSTLPEYQLVQGVIGADGVTTYPGRRITTSNFESGASNTIYGASARIDHDFDFARFVSISGYRHVRGFLKLDQDATPLPIANVSGRQYARNFSQELQLLAPKSSKIEWLVGAYYFNANYAYPPISIAGLAAAPLPSIDFFGSQKTRSYSGYGQATVPILTDTRLTAGLRYTYERQSTDGYLGSGGVIFPRAPNPLCQGTSPTNCPQHQSISKLTWRAAVDHDFSSTALGYVSYNRGIKSGGFNLINAGTPGYRPEILDAYELGLKTQFADNRIRFNVAGFIYKYKDIQVFNIAGGGAALTTNAAAARIHGLDADLTVKASQYLSLAAGFGWLDTKYTNFPNATFTPSSPLLGPQTTVDAKGNDLVFAPKISANVSGTYRVPSRIGDFSLTMTANYRGRVFVSAANVLKIPAYTVANGTVSWASRDGRFGVSVWARNLLDTNYYINRTEQALGFIQYLAPPRTVGATLTFNTR